MSIITELLGLTKHKTIDPIFLTSICNFAYDIFRCGSIIYDEKKCEIFVD